MPDAIEAIASLLRSGRASDAVTLFTANRTSWAADESVCRLAATAFAVAGDPLGGLRELQPWLAASSAAQRETLEVACRICTQLGRQGDRAEVVEEDEGADRTPRRHRQHATHLQPAGQVGDPR